MNKPQPIQKVLLFIMSVTLVQIIVTSLSLTVAYAMESNAQAILNRKITLKVENEQFYRVLETIGKQAKIKFAYSPELVKKDQKVSLDARESRLGDVLNGLLSPEIAFKVIGKQIVLLPVKQLSLHERDNVENGIEELSFALTVSGKITEENGTPMPGVNILEKGTTNGTTSNAEGVYSLNVLNENSVLAFSFIGYASQEIGLGSQTTLNVTLVSDITTLSEMVVVGYGEQRRETMTGSVSNVKGEELTKNPSPNIATSLAGRLPGLTVNQRSGWPGREDLNIMVRGVGTMDSNPDDGINPNAPLIIIDGVPRDGLSRLNPEDIESVTVLKDGSAAIYGARGANGVILVTTKTGSQSKPTFGFSYSYAFNNPTKIPDMMDAATFAEAYNEAEWYRQGRPDMSSFKPFFTDEAIQKYHNGSDPILYPNTDWIDAVTKDHSIQQKVNLRASGGTETTRYLLSFGMTDQEGNFKNNPTHYRQYNARTKFEVDLTKGLTVGANINAIFNERTYAAQFEDFVALLQSNPTLVAVYPNGLIAPGRFSNNPLLMDRSGSDKIKDYAMYSTFTAKYEVPFVDGLAVDASFNFDFRNEFQKWFRTPYHYHEYNVATGEYDRRVTPHPIELRDTYRRWTTSLSNLRLSYQKTIAQNHNISAMLGAEQQRQTFSFADAYRKNFVSSAIPQINAGSTNPDDRNNSGSFSESAYNNYFGRVNYDFKERYMIEFVFRYDGSPIFPEENRYGFFPAISAGWRLSEESFMNNVPFINELKLRGSYGELGNDRVPGYQYLQAFQFGNNYVFGGTDASGIFSSTLPNPNITWEVSKKYDLGLVAELWQGRLGVDLTLFKQQRSNILWPRNLSVGRVFGFPALPHENIGRVDNGGFELVLSHRNTIGDLVYSVSANTTFARSKVIFMDEVPPAEAYQAVTGHPVGAGLFYKSDGIFNTEEELNSYPHGSGAQVGDVKVLDLNSDGEINGEDQYRADRTSTPEYIFGLTTNFQYKGFDLTLFIQGQTKVNSYDFTLTEFGQQDLDNNTVFRAANRWTVENQQGATMPRADSWNPGTTDFFWYDATFIRLKNLEIGYSFRDILSKVKGLNDVRLFVNGTNLLTWSKEITWRDPELDGDFTEYPPVRILNFGVDVKF